MTERKETPILFSGEMVRAILEGRKTQTRRVIKPQPESVCGDYAPEFIDDEFGWGIKNFHAGGWRVRFKCPYGKPGDLLWVRETWAHVTDCGHYNHMHADNVKVLYGADGHICLDRWRPSIHMPKKFGRLWLEVVNVRVERVQEISNADVLGEGIRVKHDRRDGPSLRDRNESNQFICLWDSLNAKRGFSWQSNPWVWVIEFRRFQK
jgi:hypothetical protein